MNSSTLHRSNLSKEKIAVLEGLQSTRKKPANDAAPGVYVRPQKDKDLDVLWQSFKVNQKDEKSPGLYLLVGFIAGAVFMFLVTLVLSLATNVNNVVPESKPERKTRFDKPLFSFKPAKKAKPVEAAAPVVKNETYTIKTGDTLAGIVVRFYGKYDLEKVDKLLKVNNLSNPNKISIGQTLVIPME